jgi:trimeric autotransporter adhesin
MQSHPTAGFIAQELDRVQVAANAEWLNLVLKDNPEKWEATYGNLLPVIVKAIQEQQLKIEELIKQNEELRGRMDTPSKDVKALSVNIEVLPRESGPRK